MNFLMVHVLFIPKCPENWPFLLIKMSKNWSKIVVFSAGNFLFGIFTFHYNFFITKSFLWDHKNTNSKGLKIIKIAGLTSVQWQVKFLILHHWILTNPIACIPAPSQYVFSWHIHFFVSPPHQIFVHLHVYWFI